MMDAPREEMDTAVAQTAARVEQAEKLVKISMDDAEALAREAIQQRYALTDEQMKKLELVPESSVFIMEGEVPTAEPYFWLMQKEGAYTEKDGIYIVDVNAVDGTIEDMLYDSGLLGNG